MRGAALLSLLLAGCAAEAPAGDPVACGPAGGELAPDCAVERQGDVLIVKRPDGSFRRLARTADGLVAADGAESAVVTSGAGSDDVTIGGWTYRLPRP